MNYGIYKNVRNASWQCLIDIGANSLPVPVLRMAHHFDVNVVKNSVHHLLMPSQNGISFVYGRFGCRISVSVICYKYIILVITYYVNLFSSRNYDILLIQQKMRYEFVQKNKAARWSGRKVRYEIQY